MIARIPALATVLVGMKHGIGSKQDWSNRNKPADFYIFKLIDAIYKQAGISQTIKPGLPHLPALSMQQVEFGHMMWLHILPRQCECVVKSFVGYDNTNNIAKEFHKQCYDTLCASIYRPKNAHRTNLRDCTTRMRGVLKAMTAYRSAFELSIHGSAMGFGTFEMTLLQRTIEWNGKWMCDTWDDDLVNYLIDECHELVILCDTSPKMKPFNNKTPCLRTWLNLIDICLYWTENANIFMGMKFDGHNKRTKKKIVPSGTIKTDVMCCNYVTYQRLLKDVCGIALGYTFEGCLGNGIAEILRESECEISFINKLMMYSVCLDDDDFEIDTKSNYGNPFILHSKPLKIASFSWVQCINVCTEFYRLSEIKDVHQKIWHQLYQKFDILIQDMIVVNENDTVENIIQLLLFELSYDNLIHMWWIKGVSTFYRTWFDSVIKVEDTIWTCDSDGNDDLLRVNTMIKIDGFDKIADKYGWVLNNKFTNNWQSLLICICTKWNVHGMPLYGFDYTKYSIFNSPLISLSNDQRAISVEYIVQNMYIAHDHILPIASDQKNINRHCPGWFNPRKHHWQLNAGNNRIVSDNLQQPKHCGISWMCTSHSVIDCPRCTGKGQIIYACLEAEWPYFHAFSVYQGYACRLFNSRTVNELGW